MTIEELQEILDNIKGYGPIDNARRYAVTAMIAQMLSEEESYNG